MVSKDDIGGVNHGRLFVGGKLWAQTYWRECYTNAWKTAMKKRKMTRGDDNMDPLAKQNDELNAPKLSPKDSTEREQIEGGRSV
jgi:hypothetical protein